MATTHLDRRAVRSEFSAGGNGRPGPECSSGLPIQMPATLVGRGYRALASVRSTRSRLDTHDDIPSSSSFSIKVCTTWLTVSRW